MMLFLPKPDFPGPEIMSEVGVVFLITLNEQSKNFSFPSPFL